MRWVGGIFAGFLFASVAFAQGDGGGTKPPETKSSAPIEDTSKLSAAERKSRAEQMLVDMRSALKRATDILGEARAAKDIVQLNCVNEKLTQIKGLLRISEQSSVRMYEAMASTTDDVVNHEFTKLAVAHQKVLMLRAAADQCVGEATIYSGETEIEVEVDPDLEQDDGLDEDPPFGPSVVPVASRS